MILNEDLFDDVIEADVIEDDILSDGEDSLEDDIILDAEEDSPQIIGDESLGTDDITSRIRDQITTELSLNNVYTELKQSILQSDVEHADKYIEVIDSIVSDHAFIVGKLQGLLSDSSPEELENIETSTDDTKEQMSADLKDLLRQQEEIPDAMDVTDDDISFMSDDFAVSDGIIHR